MAFAGFLIQVQIFLLIFMRVMSLCMVAPLISSEAVPAMARVGLALMSSWIVMSAQASLGYVIPEDAGAYILLLVGEIMIGIIIGFFLQIVYAGFQTAGQFFSIQLGFGASEVYDPLSNDELPLMGQYFNLVAMYVFLSSHGLQKLFLHGVYGSFQALKAQDFVTGQAYLATYFLGALGQLFAQALTLSFPILGTLFLMSVSMGLMAKAAPQMNLLSMGFPVNMLVAFLLLIFILPQMIEVFTAMVDNSFAALDQLYRNMGGAVPAKTSIWLSMLAGGRPC